MVKFCAVVFGSDPSLWMLGVVGRGEAAFIACRQRNPVHVQCTHLGRAFVRDTPQLHHTLTPQNESTRCTPQLHNSYTTVRSLTYMYARGGSLRGRVVSMVANLAIRYKR
jgi:hypothetical protein